MPVDADMVGRAAQRNQRELVSFWGALILEAALAGGAAQLLSEDMEDGQKVSGLVTENPF